MSKRHKTSKLKGGKHLYCCARLLGNGRKSKRFKDLKAMGVARRPNGYRPQHEHEPSRI